MKITFVCENEPILFLTRTIIIFSSIGFLLEENKSSHYWWQNVDRIYPKFDNLSLLRLRQSPMHYQLFFGITHFE